MPFIRFNTTIKIEVSDSTAQKLAEGSYQGTAGRWANDPYEKFLISNCFRNNTIEVENLYATNIETGHHNPFPRLNLLYSEEMVCEACGSNDWHVNLTYNNRRGNWFYGEIDVMGDETGEDVWCHLCEGWATLSKPEDHEKEGE